ncbi:MAG: hypothetical protein Q7T83_05015 [Thermodesulfovibrionales bacterium]|nr:hypothetical protein [Thermodesulfovibrionales bacterium]MDP3112027.1 hypothetical protein [Thermodesulfovibrionales bacterium]
MEKFRNRLLYTAVGALSGLTGIASFSRCSGNACASCFGCAGAGIGVLLIVLLNKFRRSKQEGDNGMA